MLNIVIIDFACAAQIKLLHVRVRFKNGCGAAHDDMAILDQVGMVDDLQRSRCVLLDQQDTHALFFIDT